MYKKFMCASLLFLSAIILHAQHADVLKEDERFSALHTGLDEINVIDLPTTTGISKKLLKKLPNVYGKFVTITDNKKGRRRGMLVANNAEGELFSTEYKSNNLQGTWISWYPNNNITDSGRFQNNIPDGEWLSWYPDGKLRSIRTFSSEKFTAVENEISRGNPKIYFHNLSRMSGWNTRKFEAFTNAAVSFATLPVTTTKYKPPFRFCLHHGLYINYYPTGVIKDSGYFKNGLRDGIWNEYYTNGQVSATGFYLNGLKSSGWKYFNRPGNLIALEEYKKGKLLYRKKYPGNYQPGAY